MISISPLRLETVAEEFQPAFFRGAYGHSPRMPNPFPAAYVNHFLLYFRMAPDGSIDSRQMWDYGITNIANSEKYLFHAAKGPHPSPAYIGHGHANMLWKYPSYFTIVLDNDGYYFNYNADLGDDDGEPLIFVQSKFGIQYHENYSFYNAQPVTVPILDQNGQDTGQTRSGIRFTNHITGDAVGTPLPEKDWRRYKFDLAIWKPNTGGGGHTLTTTDPDGQNQGPTGVP